MTVDEQKRIFIKKLYDLQIIQFGEFTLKSGAHSPFYIDLRKMIASPDAIVLLTQLIRCSVGQDARGRLVCGVPYGAIPVAVSYALAERLPLLLLRKEKKTHGRGRQIEGVWKEGQSVILMEDVVTSGESILESARALEEEGLRIDRIVAFIDRGQGGMETLRQKGYAAHSIFTMEEIMGVLENDMPKEEAYKIYAFMRSSRQASDGAPAPLRHVSIHPKAKELLGIAAEKKSNLILSADSTTTDEIWKLVHACAASMVALKLHADIISDFTIDFARELKTFSTRHRFLLIEDRKFADIGNTQYLQICGGAARISSWADMITMHFIAGKDALRVMESIAFVGLIGIAEMSSAGALTDEKYAGECMRIMSEFPHLFVGAVCQKSKTPAPFLKFTPGVHLQQKKDDKGQRYASPEEALVERAADFIIVGRGVYENDDPQNAAQVYRQTGWRLCSDSILHKLQNI